MTSRFAALWLLLLMCFALAAPLAAGDACDEPCGTHCGDCASCPLTAELSADEERVHWMVNDLWTVSGPGSRAALPRGIDHVPLD